MVFLRRFSRHERTDGSCSRSPSWCPELLAGPPLWTESCSPDPIGPLEGEREEQDESDERDARL